MKRFFASLIALVLAGACASAPSGPPPLNAVGVFDFGTEVDGNQVAGTIEIVRSGTGYGGTLSTSMTEPVPVGSVFVEGQTMTVVANTPDGPATLVLTFEGDDFSGTWEYAGMSGFLSGSRRTQ